MRPSGVASAPGVAALFVQAFGGHDVFQAFIAARE
jgi:hypothetical protein